MRAETPLERLRLLRRLTARSAMRLRRCVARHGGRTPHPRSCPRLSAPRCSPLCTQASPSASSGSGAVAGAERLKFYVMREGGADFTFVEVDAHADVAALKDAVLTKLQLGAPADTVTLAVKGVDEPLDSTLTLVTAITAGSLAPSAKLIATIHAPAAASVQRESRAERERAHSRDHRVPPPHTHTPPVYPCHDDGLGMPADSLLPTPPPTLPRRWRGAPLGRRRGTPPRRRRGPPHRGSTW